jgi:hypothetical protein
MGTKYYESQNVTYIMMGKYVRFGIKFYLHMKNTLMTTLFH